jgi:hypothetical protein
MANSEVAKPISVAEIQKHVTHAVKMAGPQLRIERKWGHDWFAGTDLICAVSAYKQHVDIEFWRGSTIPDPTGLLEGTGKALRHVKVHTRADAESPALRALLHAAILLDADEPRRTR